MHIAHSAPRVSLLLLGVAVVAFGAGTYGLLLYLSPALPFFSPYISAEEPVAQKMAVARENRLYIPTIGLTVPFDGESDERALERGAWHRRPENGNPKDGGNFVLSGHRFVMSYTPWQTARQSPFYNIDKVAIGSDVIVDYQGKRYYYVVKRLFGVKPSDTALEDRSHFPKLTLYSCTLRGSYDGRDVIEALPR